MLAADDGSVTSHTTTQANEVPAVCQVYRPGLIVWLDNNTGLSSPLRLLDNTQEAKKTLSSWN
jgi:hypothetical protein